MNPYDEFEDVPEDHPDRLENSGMPKSVIERLLRNTAYRRLKTSMI
ncbi:MULTISPECIES: hypothetical protein [Rhizobium]|uniref:Uncharacterized protein n=1 Tax=Rhizobium aouanii TaxID=3118145 RepID=A0ABU8CJ88_9HYPH|nr:hypothetical protein [Rhizobium acaciae]MCW1410724.1 hypothetical protein [Rhizobium acaciae]MCW1742977.1 hypothetical protein [Rhizobium acaciae]MCW1750173.1 hypothetical protein [Rhizobium acaciae]